MRLKLSDLFQPTTFFITIACVVFSIHNLRGQNTEIQYLSGTGSDQTVNWQFYVTEGRNSGEWTTIPVPSNWEQFGFGTYNYGHAKDEERGKEKGLYKHEFEVPSDWKNKQIDIVFEGSMTDTEVKINGKLAGKVHQGAFYRFKYDISKLLKYGASNMLEVSVAKHSANTSVNKAERYADFWIFGGIFRPVFLEAKPKQYIEHLAIDAKADGQIRAELKLKNISSANSIRAQVLTLAGEKVGATFTSKIKKNQNTVSLESQLQGIKTWNPERPQLYELQVELLHNNNVIHEQQSRFGFRTVELRERDGIYVNDVRIKFKGVNRHTFWPTTGRASSKERSIKDVQLIKDMNMNAVRMSHYPPDTHFLEAADSLGLFVLNELAGWHDAYDTETGTRLVEAMVKRDVNHPSILFWDNGNEGGHNFELDEVFTKVDLQKRLVIHPWQTFNGMSNEHYRPYNYGVGTFWNGNEVVFPTEFLHGMYDGGSAAGLYEFWEMMWDNPLASGGFLWVFADEGIKRTDTGKIDTYHGSAADGILGPFHEKEASYFAIKEIWAPIHFQELNLSDSFDGNFLIENRYFYTNLKEVSFHWTLIDLQNPEKSVTLESIEGQAISPNIAPGRNGLLQLDLPEKWQQYDVLKVKAIDQHGQEIYTWAWPIKIPKKVLSEIMPTSLSEGLLEMDETSEIITVKAGEMRFQISKDDGLLKKVKNAKGEIPFNNGPHLSAGNVVFKSMKTKKAEDQIEILCSFKDDSRLKELTWTFFPSGWCKLEIYYKPEEYDVDFDFMGIDFDYPEKLVKGVKWLGNGPYRVWKNRLQGAEFDLHQKEYNNTITGVSPLIYPEFKGYHSNFYWAKILTKDQDFLVATSTENVFLRLFTPDYPQDVCEARTSPAFPSGNISFMQAIPAIGSKTNQPDRLGPASQKNIFFDYGTFDDWRLRSKHMVVFFNFTSEQN